MPLGAFKSALFGASADTGTAVLLSTLDASSSSSVELTTGLTSAYKQFVVKYYGLVPATDAALLHFQGSTDGGSSYGVTITSTFFYAQQHYSWDTTASLAYDASRDLAQSTSDQVVSLSIDNQGTITGSALCGEMILYNPASTTYVKHWTSRTVHPYHLEGVYDNFTAGYFNTTSAINALKWTMSSGNFSGTIKVWGIK